MEGRKKIVYEFLNQRGHQDDIVGVVVAGSYILGNPTNHSDIDLHIILSEDTKRRERGNIIIEGILVEYFANPITTYHHYFQDDYKKNKIVCAHMLATGFLLKDTNNQTKELIEKAKKRLHKPYKKSLNNEIESNKYFIRDIGDNLQETYEKGSPDFLFVYYTSLYDIHQMYARYVGYHTIKQHKIHPFLTNQSFLDKYGIDNFPDKKYKNIFTKTIAERNRDGMMSSYKELQGYILNAMGGFTIDGWSLKSEAPKNTI